MNLFLSWFYYYVIFVHVENFVKAVDPQQWNDFKIQFGKNYATPEEDQQKMKVYEDNLDKIAKHNEKFQKGEESFEMGMNNFGDMTSEEFAKTYFSKLQSTNGLEAMSNTGGKDPLIVTSLPPNSCPVPESKNWVREGAVTEIKDQGRCGCCWAFAIVGVIESHNSLYTRTCKNLVSLSEQNLLDCVGSQYEGVVHDCTGGSMIYPLQYVVNNKGIDMEESYPYTEKQGECKYKAENKGATIKSYKRPLPGDEELLKGIVGVIGPVASSFSAESDFIQFYKSGVYSSKTCGNTVEKVNHAVVVVGYGTTKKNKDYWLVKNSWGKGWGDKGYFKLSRGSNECGISIENYYPII